LEQRHEGEARQEEKVFFEHPEPKCYIKLRGGFYSPIYCSYQPSPATKFMWEDDDDDHDDDGYDPEEEQRKLEALPIYKKALEILDLTEQIVDTFNDEGRAKYHRELMLQDAMIIPAKIAGAEAMDDYILKMENATIIKIHARSLLTQTSSAKYLDLQDERYLKLLRDEIEGFRLLFLQWVQTFETGTIKEGDGWGLFVKE
jgi:hypothetical protein